MGNQLDPAATVRWITPERMIYTFRSPYLGTAPMLGRLVSIADLNGNAVTLAYYETGVSQGLVRQITDSVGGIWLLNYDAFGNTTATVDQRGTRTTMTYDARSNLLTSTNVPLNLKTTWIYGHTLTYGPIPAGIPSNQASNALSFYDFFNF